MVTMVVMVNTGNGDVDDDNDGGDDTHWRR